MLAVFQRATQKALAKLGEGSLLDGSPAGRVNIERDVEVDRGLGNTAYDNPIVRVSVATIDKQYAPRTGQTLGHPDGTFRLDTLLDENGYSARYIVVPV